MKLLLPLGFLLVASAAHAELITFDGLASGTTLSNQYTGVTFAAGTGGLSVPNSTTTIEGFATNTSLTVMPLSIANTATAAAPLSGGVLHSRAGWISENGDPVFTITFANPITAFSLDFGSVDVPRDSVIYAYTATGTSAIASTKAVAAGGLNQTVSLSNLVGVTRIAVTPGSYGDYVAVDNVRYTTAVPEPATMAALGLGALALVKRRRKR